METTIFIFDQLLFCSFESTKLEFPKLSCWIKWTCKALQESSDFGALFRNLNCTFTANQLLLDTLPFVAPKIEKPQIHIPMSIVNDWFERYQKRKIQKTAKLMTRI
jgi:hypothetical protein